MIAKQVDVRANIKKYFDMACDGEAVIVPRKQNRNVVIISENEYRRLTQKARLDAYAQALSSDRDRKNRMIKDRSGSLKNHNMEKLSAIRSLKSGWNGNGAPAFSKSLIDRIGSLIDILDIQPEIFPTAMGTIQLEYDNSRKDHMEIEISDDNGEADVFIISFNGVETYERIPVTPDAIAERTALFYG